MSNVEQRRQRHEDLRWALDSISPNPAKLRTIAAAMKALPGKIDCGELAPLFAEQTAWLLLMDAFHAGAFTDPEWTIRKAELDSFLNFGGWAEIMPGYRDSGGMEQFVRGGCPLVAEAIESQAETLKLQRNRKPHNRQQQRRVTARQAEAVQLFGEYGGNITKAARAMGVSRAAFEQHYKAGLKNAGTTAGMMLAPKVGKYGDVHAADEDEGQAVPTLGPRAKTPTKRR